MNLKHELTCGNCGKVLRSDRPNSTRAIKCPSCGQLTGPSQESTVVFSPPNKTKKGDGRRKGQIKEAKPLGLSKLTIAVGSLSFVFLLGLTMYVLLASKPPDQTTVKNEESRPALPTTVTPDRLPEVSLPSAAEPPKEVFPDTFAGHFPISVDSVQYPVIIRKAPPSGMLVDLVTVLNSVHFLFGISPNRRIIVTRFAESNSPMSGQSLVCFDAQTGIARGQPIPLPAAIPEKQPWRFLSIAISPDSKLLLTGAAVQSDDLGEARLWDLETGQPLGEPMSFVAAVTSVAFSPRGDRFVVGWGQAVVAESGATIFDTKTRDQVGRSLQHTGPVDHLCFSPDNKFLLTSSRMDHEAKLWNLADGSLVGFRMVHNAGVTAASISPDGRFLATGAGDGQLNLWNFADQGLVNNLSEHRAPIWDLAFSNDSQRLATAGGDRQVRLWNTDGTRLGQSMEHGGAVMKVAFDSSGKVLISGDMLGSMRYWNGESGSPIGPAVPGIYQFQLVGDATHLLAAQMTQLKLLEISLGARGSEVK